MPLGACTRREGRVRGEERTLRSAQHNGEGTVECARKASERERARDVAREIHAHARRVCTLAMEGYVHNGRSVTSSPPQESAHTVEPRWSGGTRRNGERTVKERWKSDGRAMEERRMFGEGLPGRAKCDSEGLPEVALCLSGSQAWPIVLTISSTSAVVRQSVVLPDSGGPTPAPRPSRPSPPCPSRLLLLTAYASCPTLLSIWPDSGSTTTCLVLNGVRPQLSNLVGSTPHDL